MAVQQPSPRAVRLADEARELAHDLDNLLNPLGLQVALLERRIGDDEVAARVLAGMRDVLRRAEGEIQRLRRLGDQLMDGGVERDGSAAVTDPEGPREA